MIVRPDNKLIVKSSAADEKNEERTKIVGAWEKWVKEVEKRRVAGEGGGNEFSPKPPGGSKD